jgi:hypothetical protein
MYHGIKCVNSKGTNKQAPLFPSQCNFHNNLTNKKINNIGIVKKDILISDHIKIRTSNGMKKNKIMKEKLFILLPHDLVFTTTSYGNTFRKE